MKDHRGEQLMQLWASLELQQNDQATDVIIIAKVVNFETGATGISIGATEGVDWVTQLGLIEGAKIVTQQSNLRDLE